MPSSLLIECLKFYGAKKLLHVKLCPLVSVVRPQSTFIQELYSFGRFSTNFSHIFLMAANLSVGFRSCLVWYINSNKHEIYKILQETWLLEKYSGLTKSWFHSLFCSLLTTDQGKFANRYYVKLSIKVNYVTSRSQGISWTFCDKYSFLNRPRADRLKQRVLRWESQRCDMFSMEYIV